MDTYYKSGSWNICCDVCGFRFKADEIKKRWDGLLVCKDDYEQDHPQKYIRVHETGETVPYIREEADEFKYVCYLYARCSYANLAEADCAQADYTVLSYLDALRARGPIIPDEYIFPEQIYFNDLEILFNFDELGLE